MKFLISLNSLRTLNEPKLQVQMFEQIGLLDFIDGIEINANLDDPLEVVRLREYAELLNERDMLIQVHTPKGFSTHYNDYDILAKAIHVYGKLANKINQRIRVVIHSVEHKNIETAQYRTMKLISKLNALRTIYQYDIEYTLENLTYPRLNLHDIEPMLNKEHVKFCWDIGHSIMNKFTDYQLNDAHRKNLSNVHIHDVNTGDHHPFIYGRTDYLKAMQYLQKIGYDETVVVEMHYPNLRGDSLHEKFEDYLYQVALVKNAYNTFNSMGMIM